MNEVSSLLQQESKANMIQCTHVIDESMLIGKTLREGDIALQRSVIMAESNVWHHDAESIYQDPTYRRRL